MPDDISKQTAYITYTSDSAASASTGYAVLNRGQNFAAAPSASAYAVIGQTSGGAASAGAYAVLAPPAAVSASRTYGIAWGGASAIQKADAFAVLSTRYPPYEALPVTLGTLDRQFPTCVSFGSSGGPGFKTSIYEVDSGLTATRIDWDRIRARYTANFDHVTPADIAAVEEFFYGMKGRAIAFRYKDWTDYTIANQNIFVGDGTSVVFQAFKRYTSGGVIYDRIIKKLVAGTVALSVDGVVLIIDQDYFVNFSTGQIIMATAPADGAIGTIVNAQFDVPARFDTDFLSVSYDQFNQLSIAELPLIEVLI